MPRALTSVQSYINVLVCVLTQTEDRGPAAAGGGRAGKCPLLPDIPPALGRPACMQHACKHFHKISCCWPRQQRRAVWLWDASRASVCWLTREGMQCTAGTPNAAGVSQLSQPMEPPLQPAPFLPLPPLLSVPAATLWYALSTARVFPLALPAAASVQQRCCCCCLVNKRAAPGAAVAATAAARPPR